jgi:molybdate transport system substrate-binding protein
MRAVLAACTAVGLMAASAANGADIKVLSAGAFKQIVLAVQPSFEQQTGHRLVVDNDTVGALVKRIESGETFDVVFVSPAAADGLTKAGKVAGERVDLARVGVGVMVREGAAVPNVSTVEDFKMAVLAAKSVAYIDPKSGGSSGIYLDRLFVQLGIADAVRPKAKLKNGGYVADLLVSGDAELGIHQISEIVPVKGIRLVGPLPKEIQNYTVYSAAVSATTTQKEAVAALIRLLSGADAARMLESKGMEPAGRS